MKAEDLLHIYAKAFMQGGTMSAFQDFNEAARNLESQNLKEFQKFRRLQRDMLNRWAQAIARKES
jgi:hypothetical protein